MTRTVLLTTSVVLALMAACTAALLAASMKPAQATFAGRNGDIAFISDRQGHPEQVFRMKPDGTNVRNVSNIEPDSNGTYISTPVWSPDGTKIAWVGDTCPDNGDGYCLAVWVGKADGTGVSTVGAGDSGLGWFPSSRRLVFTDDYYFGPLYTVSLDADGKATGPQTPLTTYREGVHDGGPAISPDGKKVAFVSQDRDDDPDDPEIYVIGADAPEGPDNQALQLTANVTYGDYGPDWSPDGSKLVYTSCRNGNCDVFTMNADGSGKRNLTQTSTVDEQGPLWSPSGPSRILYRRNGDIFVMNADGSGKKNLTQTSTVNEWHAVWSPDGYMIAFESDQGGDYEIWKVSASTRTKTQLTKNTFEDREPDWQPLP